MKQRILFVCLGNICRSPAAEGIMRRLVDENGLSGEITVDSAGTYGGHAGDLPDSRMRRAASRRGFGLTPRRRPTPPPPRMARRRPCPVVRRTASHR